MEIIEVVTFHLNNFEEVLEVSRRTQSDNQERISEAKITYIDLGDFG